MGIHSFWYMCHSKEKVSFCITSTRNPRSFKCKGMGKSGLLSPFCWNDRIYPRLAYLLVDSRKLLTQISTAGRTDFKIKKRIPKAVEIDENFDIPEINMEDLTDMMNGNTARPQDITLRERREEFLTFEEEMLDFSVIYWKGCESTTNIYLEYSGN